MRWWIKKAAQSHKFMTAKLCYSPGWRLDRHIVTGRENRRRSHLKRRTPLNSSNEFLLISFKSVHVGVYIYLDAIDWHFCWNPSTDLIYDFVPWISYMYSSGMANGCFCFLNFSCGLINHLFINLSVKQSGDCVFSSSNLNLIKFLQKPNTDWGLKYIHIYLPVYFHYSLKYLHKSQYIFA